METAYFAAGCFWGVEEKFRVTNGVIETEVGYMNGSTENPTYENVCSHKTGHAEVVKVVFDPNKITYEALLKLFWSIHDPTTINKQGADIGDQYRSAVFYVDDAQKEIAEKTKKHVQGSFVNSVVTEITKADTFYKAEDYHQKYLMKRSQGTCPI